MEHFANIRMFVLAVQTGSFSAAARKRNVTPSSIARQVAALEEHLGVRLLNRTTRSMELTESGRVYFERALGLVRDYDEMNHEVANLEATPRGLLRVSASVSLGTTRLATVLPEYLARYPGINVQLVLSDRVVDLVEDNVDVALRIARTLPDSNLIGRKLFRYQRVICGSPRYLEALSTPACPEDLINHECLTFHAGGELAYAQSNGVAWTFRRAEEVETVTVGGRMESNNLAALIVAALNGAGLLLVPRWMVEGHLACGALTPVLSDYVVDPTNSEIWVHAVYGSNRFISPKVRTFIDFIIEKFEETTM